MNPMMSGLFGVNKAPQHEQEPELFSFGGYGADGNPMAVRPPQGAQSLTGMMGAAPYALPKGLSHFTPTPSLRATMSQPGLGLLNRNYPSGENAMQILRNSGLAQKMDDNVFNRWANQGYESEDERKNAWEAAYGTGGVGGRYYQPLVSPKFPT